MHDLVIREALHKKVLSKYHSDSNSRVIDEFGLDHGTVRVDIAIANGVLHGYEIKGAYDNLLRLSNQAEVYSDIFDKMTLVVSESHLDDSIKIIPDWWGVVTVTQGNRGAVHFSTHRKASKNTNINLLPLARLLWRDEAMELLKQKNPKGLSGKSREDLCQQISETFSHTELRNYVCDIIKQRQYWRGR